MYSKNGTSNTGGIIQVPVDLPNSQIPWFMREGRIIIWQDATGTFTAS